MLVEELVEDGAVDGAGFTDPAVEERVVVGAVTEPDAPAVVSAPAVAAGADVVAEAFAEVPVLAPDHQSLEARLLGDAFR